MTTIGENRVRYSLQVEAAPSRYINPAEYASWSLRADRWAAAQ